MVLGAPHEENAAIETGTSFCFTAPQVPAGTSGWDVAGLCYNREPAALAALSSRERLKPGGTASKYREKRTSPRHSQCPGLLSCTAQMLAIVWPLTRLGFWQSRAGVAPLLQAERCCTHTMTHVTTTMRPHAGICLSSSASPAASKPGPLCTPEPQHPAQSLTVLQALQHHGA